MGDRTSAYGLPFRYKEVASILSGRRSCDQIDTFDGFTVVLLQTGPRTVGTFARLQFIAPVARNHFAGLNIVLLFMWSIL